MTKEVDPEAEKIIDKLVKIGLLEKVGKDKYKRGKNFDETGKWLQDQLKPYKEFLISFFKNIEFKISPNEMKQLEDLALRMMVFENQSEIERKKDFALPGEYDFISQFVDFKKMGLEKAVNLAKERREDFLDKLKYIG